MPYSDPKSSLAIANQIRANIKRRKNRKLFRLANPLVRIPKRFCKQGHDTLITGRRNNGCVQCLHDRSIRWNKEHIDEKRNISYKKKYGMTLEQYNSILIKQNFSCAICLIHQSQLLRRLNVDHDHKTGNIRGLLCWNCNKHLGWIENKDFCAKATIYLQGAQQCL